MIRVYIRDSIEYIYIIPSLIVKLLITASANKSYVPPRYKISRCDLLYLPGQHNGFQTLQYAQNFNFFIFVRGLRFFFKTTRLSCVNLPIFFVLSSAVCLNESDFSRNDSALAD